MQDGEVVRQGEKVKSQRGRKEEELPPKMSVA